MHAPDMQAELSESLFEAQGRKYLRAPVPVEFPEEELVPQSSAHERRRQVLADSLRLVFGSDALVSSDQFLYWDATDPAKCLAPDVALRRGPEGALLGSWKIWERGAPEVAVEIVSDSDRPPPRWKLGLERYQATGVEELVRFDPTRADKLLRVWDRVDGDLIERKLERGTSAECVVLGLWWVVVEDARYGFLLRLARDAEGQDLLFTPEEQARAAQRAAEAERAREADARRTAEAERAREADARRMAEAERAREADARRAAERRVAALEAQLRAHKK